jgi:hypothetical protein
VLSETVTDPLVIALNLAAVSVAVPATFPSSSSHAKVKLNSIEFVVTALGYA